MLLSLPLKLSLNHDISRAARCSAVEGDSNVEHPQRFEITLFGTSIRAEGVAGILGVIALVGLMLAINLAN